MKRRSVLLSAALIILALLVVQCNIYVAPAASPTIALISDNFESTIQPVPATETLFSTQTSAYTEKPQPLLTPSSTEVPAFTFVVNTDPHHHTGPGEFDTSLYFRGMCETIASLGETAFMVTTGDILPPQDARWTIDRTLGSNYPWFPVVGNHNLNDVDLGWLNGYAYDPNGAEQPNIVHSGPQGCEQTTYSFDYENAHFVVLNVYCDSGNERRTDGAIVDTLYDWLAEDFASTDQEHIFVFGHEPAFPQPDADLRIARHIGDSLDQYPVTRDRFWQLLSDSNVVAYFTGHTHSYSAAEFDGVWQVDAGHAQGAYSQATPSTFLLVHVRGGQVSIDVYRMNAQLVYELKHFIQMR